MTNDLIADWADFRRWAPVAGRWQPELSTAAYLGPDASVPGQAPYGILLSGLRVRGGEFGVRVTFRQVQSVGRIVVGYSPTTAHFSAGIGGYGRAYVLDEFRPDRGWVAVTHAGAQENLAVDTPYALRVELTGQSIRLNVDDVRVVETNLPHPAFGDQVGLFAFGSARIEFSDFWAKPDPPRAFVVMQYSEPFASLYNEVIEPIANELGFESYRASDVYKPGIILEDIRRGLVESDVIVAEITPVNANVFYELGYAHALGKPTILLADRSSAALPFDISGYRCIFYDNTIHGKRAVEDDLRRHLLNIKRGSAT